MDQRFLFLVDIALTSLIITANGGRLTFEDLYVTADPRIDSLYINGMMFPPENLKYRDKWHKADVIPILKHTWSVAVKVSKENFSYRSLNFLDKKGLMAWSRSGALSTNAERWRCKGTYPGLNWFGNMSISTWPHPRVVGINLKTLNRHVNNWPSQVENIYFKAYWVWPSTVDAGGTAYCVLAIDPQIYETPVDPKIFGINPNMFVILFFVFLGIALLIPFKIVSYIKYRRGRTGFANLLTQERDGKTKG